MKTKTRVLLGLILAVMSVSISASVVAADPTGPDAVTPGAPTTRIEGTAGRAVQAEAGNMTPLNINDSRQTNHWQGFYGNVSGNIVLDDALNMTMYSWGLVPAGEVYAVNSSAAVTWSGVYCVNLTGNGTAPWQIINESTLETQFGMLGSEKDGIGETFNETYVSATGFRIGTNVIDTNDYCRMAYTYVNEAYQQSAFKEFLLSDNTTTIFATTLENSQPGYTGGPLDFQMLVPVNNLLDPVSYYFYVELE